jgi:hypothetical protein
MNRRDYYFLQLLSESELDDGFEHAEVADRAIIADLGHVGIVSGLSVGQHSPTADLTVDVSSGTAYNPGGERMQVSTLQVLDVSIDHLSVSTDVTGGPGYEKIVSVSLEFDRSLSDPRIDGNSNTVYFVRNESFDFHVKQGSETTSLPATPPALESAMVLLADIRRSDGQTQILNSDITPPGGTYTAINNRREEAFKLSAGSLSVLEGTPEESDQAILTELNNHVAGVANLHPASTIDYAGGSAWLDSATNPATDVESQLDKLITDLINTTSPNSGAHKTGSGALNSTLTTGLDLSAGSVASQLQDIIDKMVPIDGSETWTGVNTFANDVTFATGSEIISTIAGDLTVTIPGSTGAFVVKDDGGLEYLRISDVTGRIDIDGTALKLLSGVDIQFANDNNPSTHISYEAYSGTGTDDGKGIVIQAQQGQAVGSGTNNDGGPVELRPGIAGTGGTAGTGVSGPLVVRRDSTVKTYEYFVNFDLSGTGTWTWDSPEGALGNGESTSFWVQLMAIRDPVQTSVASNRHTVLYGETQRDTATTFFSTETVIHTDGTGALDPAVTVEISSNTPRLLVTGTQTGNKKIQMIIRETRMPAP